MVKAKDIDAGRVALVTGSSRGLGRAIALRLAQDGMAVAINYRSGREAAEALASKLRSNGGRAIAIEADLAERDRCRLLVERVRDELGPIDVLVNNAGVFVEGDLTSIDFQAFEDMRRINFDAVVHVTQAAVDDMKARGWGRIVNISSLAGLGTSQPGTTFYAATKAALNMLTRRLALEFGPGGITVNAIAPGFTVTDMVAAAGLDLDAIAAASMVKRLGRPEEIAAAVSYLVSDDADFVTAQILAVDGGRSNYLVHT
jgi:3-oxoacyl-[acyl-carrier protein] reductase